MKKKRQIIKLLLSSFLASFGQNGDIAIASSKGASKEYLFTENHGQISNQFGEQRNDIFFAGASTGLNFYFKGNGISYQINQKNTDDKDSKLENGFKQRINIYRVDIDWPGANQNAILKGMNPSLGTSNYYLEHCPNGILGVKTYEKILYENIYNGISLMFYSKDKSLEYDYYVSAGADYKKIILKVSGAEKMYLENGNVNIVTPFGKIVQEAPLAFQNGKQLKANWVIKENQLSFAIENYDASQALIIDPISRVWGTYYGSSMAESGYDCTTDAQGNSYLTGATPVESGTIIATVGSHQTSFGGGSLDAYLSKFNPSGVRLWSTYYGGSGDEDSRACTTNSLGDVYITGQTSSTASGVISTTLSHQPVYGGGTSDAYLVKFNNAGVRIWSTYYGGTNTDQALSCSTNSLGDVFIVGGTASSNGINVIATPGAHETTSGGGFVVKFNSTGVRQWGTYYGSTISDCSADNIGNIFIAGTTGVTSGTSIATPGSHQPAFGGIGSFDGFLAKFNSVGVRQWGTYYGAASDDRGNSCATDPAGNVYLYGQTMSSGGTVIATPGSHQPAFAPGPSFDTYLAKFNTSGIRQWATYYGGTAVDYGYVCTTDNLGNIYIGGATSNGGAAITTNDGYQTILSSPTDAFLVKFDSFGVRQWGTLYGGTSSDFGFGIGVDINGDSFLCGHTQSSSGPIVGSIGSQQPIYGGGQDAFLVKFTGCSLPAAPIDITPISNLTVCTNGTSTLSVTGTSVSWFSSPGGGVSIGSGTAFITPSLPSTTSFYAESTTCGPSANRTQITVTVIVCSALNEISFEKAEIIAYPNPNIGQFQIDLKNKTVNPCNLRIYNLIGELIKNQNISASENRIDLTDYPDGVYILSVSNSKQIINYKIIKQAQ